jgi:hypothetical protein
LAKMGLRIVQSAVPRLPQPEPHHIKIRNIREGISDLEPSDIVVVNVSVKTRTRWFRLSRRCC